MRLLCLLLLFCFKVSSSMFSETADFTPEGTIQIPLSLKNDVLETLVDQFCTTEPDDFGSLFDNLHAALKDMKEHEITINLNPLHPKTTKSLVHYCLKYEYYKLFNRLCAKGADLDVIENGHKATPLLHGLIRTQKPSIVKQALKAGADPYKIDASGQNALHIACCASQGTAICKLLLELYAMDIDQKTDLGAAPLHCAVFIINEQTIKLLLDKGVCKEVIDDITQKTPLQIAHHWANMFQHNPERHKRLKTIIALLQ